MAWRFNGLLTRLIMEKAERVGIRSGVLDNCTSNMLTNHDGTAQLWPRLSGALSPL